MEVNMKKFIALFLLIALALSVLAACNNTAETSQTSETGKTEESQPETSVNPNSEWQDANGKWVPKHEVKDLSDKTFRIIVRGDVAGTYQSDDFTYGEDTSGLYGDLLGDAVKERNALIEQIYGVTLEVVRSNSIANDIRNDITNNLGDYDAIMPTMTVLADLAAEDMLIDLTSIENFDIYAPWYDANATKAFSIHNQVYFTTGDITILNKVCSPSILFNKEMVTNYGLENPYDLVRNHKWTFDKLMEMGKAVSSTTNEDVFQNTYGMLTTYDDPFNFWGQTGELIVDKDGDDMPYLKIGQEQRSINVATKLLDEYANGDDWLIFASDPAFASNMWVESLRLFSEGHALFRPSAFSATTKLRKNSDLVFGILPCPLYDETQEKYVSYCGSSEVAGIAIPKSALDIDFSAYMIDACSAYAKNTITHAYYDVNLVLKDASYDTDSVEMLDIIFDNIVYDLGECYNIGGIKGQFRSLASARSTDIVSALATVKDTAETKLQELIEQFED